MLEFIKNKYIILLLGIFCVGLILKLINFWDVQIFAYDQARDAQRVLEILAGNFKLVGPETDIKGIFNGPLFYYLLAPIYFLSNFNPNIVNLFMVFVNLSGIFIIYYLCVVLFKNRNIGLISSFLWAISYEQANFARFISNASFMPICTLIFFLGLSLYFLRKNRWGLYISLIGLGTAIHFNIYLAYLIILYPILFLIYRPGLKLKDAVLGLAVFSVILSPFALAELKWNFMSIKALISYFGKHANEGGSILSNLNSYPARITGALYYGFFSFNKLLSLVLYGGVLLFVYKNLKDKKALTYLFIWAFSTFPLFFFKSGVITAEVINTSIFGALTILFGLAIYYLINGKFKLLGIILLTVIIISNLSLFVADRFSSYRLFTLQALVLKDEKDAIDYTYNSSNGQDFSVCAVTNPLFINTLWSFLYKNYGEKNFNFLPKWSGQKQNLNASLIPYDTKRVQDRYLIIEPLGALPEFTAWATIYMEDQISVLVEERRFGSIIVQKRRLSYNKGKPRDTQRLSSEYLSRTLSLISDEQRYSCYNNY